MFFGNQNKPNYTLQGIENEGEDDMVDYAKVMKENSDYILRDIFNLEYQQCRNRVDLYLYPDGSTREVENPNGDITPDDNEHFLIYSSDHSKDKGSYWDYYDNDAVEGYLIVTAKEIFEKAIENYYNERKSDIGENLTFADYIREKIKTGDEFDSIIGDVDMPATSSFLPRTELTDYCFEKYGELLNSPCKVIKEGTETETEVVEVFCDDYKMGESFIYACAGYVSVSEDEKLFGSQNDPNYTLYDYKQILSGNPFIEDIVYEYKKGEDSKWQEDALTIKLKNGLEYSLNEDRRLISLNGTDGEKVKEFGKEILDYLNPRYKTFTDYISADPFPDNDKFKGVQKYHCLAALNNTVLGVRVIMPDENGITDYSYATWSGSLQDGLQMGHYGMSREAAFEDFARRANLIPSDKLLTEEEYQAKKRKEEIEDTLKIGDNIKLSFYVTEIYDEKTDKKLCTVVSDYFTENDIYENEDIATAIKGLNYDDDRYVTAISQLYTVGSGYHSSPLSEEKKAYITQHLDEVIEIAKPTGDSKTCDINTYYLEGYSDGRQQGGGRH